MQEIEEVLEKRKTIPMVKAKLLVLTPEETKAMEEEIERIKNREIEIKRKERR